MEGKRILIVDDDRTTGKVIELQLQKMGYVVVSVAKSAQLAIEDVRIHSPDLVLMDINLGTGMDGIEAADIISKDHKVPVVYVTAYADEGTLSRAKLTRPYGYINKPLRETDLRTTITLALERAQAVREAAEPALNAQSGMGKMQIVLNKDGEIIRSNAPKKNSSSTCGLKRLKTCCRKETLNILPAHETPKKHN